MPQKLNLHGWAKFWWVFWNIITLGFLYFHKLVLMKAMMDVLNAQQAQQMQQAWANRQPPLM
jgi:hypothetical protein